MITAIILLQALCIGLLATMALILYRLARPARHPWAERWMFDGLASVISVIRLADGKPAIQLAPLAPSSLKFLISVAEHVRTADPVKIVVIGSVGFAISLASLMRGMGARGRIISVIGDENVREHLQSQLKNQGFGERSTVIVSQTSKQKMNGFATELIWYDLESSSGSAEIAEADLLVLPLLSSQTKIDRLAAGPSLLPRLSSVAHIFVEYGRARRDRGLSRKWRNTFPDLGIRQVSGATRVEELFFLDQKIRAFLPEHLEK